MNDQNLPEHTENIQTVPQDTLKTSPIRTDAGATQAMSGARSHTTKSRTVVLSTGGRTESISISKLARLSATARIRIFPGRKDMDNEIRQAEEQHAPEAVDDSGDEASFDLPPLTSQYESGIPFAVGGRGILRTATDKYLHRLVAVKSLRKEFIEDGEARHSFIKEAKITAQLDHPCVIPIYSLHSEEHNNISLSMKYVNGHTFKYYLEMVDRQYAENGISQFDARKALFSRLELFLRACDAIEYAHSRNIMHCDLKPENIMLGEYREVYVMDWGLAKPIHVPGVTRENWVSPEKITGTPRYLSPEAVSGQFCDERSDLYALGLILHETVTLTGAVPGETRDDLIINIRDGTLAPIEHKYGIWIDRGLKAIIRKATEQNPNDRYASVADFSADIRRYLRDEEVLARPDHILGKLLRFCRRHSGSTLLSVFALFVVAGSAMTYTLVRDLTSLYRNSERDYQIGEAYVGCVLAAKDVDRVFLEQRQLLDTVYHSFDLFRDSGLTAQVPDYLPEQGKGFPAFCTDSGIFTREQIKDAHMVSMLVPHIKSVLLKDHSSLQDIDPESSLVTRFFFAFSNELVGAYPGDNLNLEQMLSREEKQKFTSLLIMPKEKKGDGQEKEYSWTFGKLGEEDVIVCRKKILSEGQDSGSGTVSLVIPVKKLRVLLTPVMSGKRQYLLDEEGNVIFQSQDDVTDSPMPALEKNVARIAVMRKYGHTLDEENGKKVLWCSNPIPSTGWIWLECVPMKNDTEL